MATSKNVLASIDGFVNQASPTTNYGATTKLWVNGTGGTTMRSFIFFPRPFAAATAAGASVTVTSAVLNLFLATAWSGSNPVTAKRVNTTWAESTVNWNNQPTTDALNSSGVTITGGAAGDLAQIDLTAIFNDVAAGLPYFGIMLTTAATASRQFWSSENTASLVPFLAVTWVLGPEPPGNLKPVDGSTVDNASILVNWSFQDQDGTATQAASQVQVDDTSDLSSPLWDSGSQPNVVGEETLGYDIQTITITGTPTGGTWSAIFGGQTAAGIVFNATAAQLQTALNALTTISGLQAKLTTALAGTNNDLDFTAVNVGTAGNAITITYVDPGVTTAAESITVTQSAIVVILRRSAGGVLSTSAQVAAALAADFTARSLVSTANTAGNTGAGSVTAMGATNLAGGTNANPVTVSGTQLPGGSLQVKFNLGRSQGNITTTDALTGGSTPASHVTHTLVGIDIASTNLRYWRVRVTDSNGSVSAYSPISSLTRLSKSTLTLVSPGSTVNEATPPILWTFGGNQTSYRAVISETVTGNLIWDSTRIAGGANTITPPSGRLVTTSPNFYTLTLQVWDDKGRVDNNGDPAYNQVQQVFTFSKTSAAANVLTLQAIAQYAAVQLTWTRTATPDFFALTVDDGLGGGPKTPKGTDSFGQTWDRLLPGDYFVSGTTYAAPFYKARPGSQSTFCINAVVNNAGVMQVTQNDPTAVCTPDPAGLTILDTHSGIFVVLLTTNQRASYEWDLGEEAVEYYPLGRQDPVRVTASMRGYEGTVNGEMKDFAGFTADQMRQNLETMKSEMGEYELRLIVQGINIPIRLGNVKLAPVHPKGYQVSIEFVQIGEFAVSPADV